MKTNYKKATYLLTQSGNRNLERLNISILGFVENIDKEFCKYKYALSPTVFGSGIRLKILHAMALGKVFLLQDIMLAR